MDTQLTDSPSTESDKARAWRERMGLSVMQLEELSGYSREAIYSFEKGRRWDGKHSEFARRRYRLVCSAIEQQLQSGKEFEW